MNVRRFSMLISLFLLLPMAQATAAPIYIFPVADCTVNYAHAHHDYAATDISKKDTEAQFAFLPETVRNNIFGKIYNIAGSPKDVEWNWGELHVRSANLS